MSLGPRESGRVNYWSAKELFGNCLLLKKKFCEGTSKAKKVKKGIYNIDWEKLPTIYISVKRKGKIR